MKIDFDSERRETPVLNGVAILFHTSVSVESLMSSWLKPAAAGGANFRKGIQNNVFLLLQGVRGRRIFFCSAQHRCHLMIHCGPKRAAI
jgi:hypothetical protein